MVALPKICHNNLAIFLNLCSFKMHVMELNENNIKDYLFHWQRSNDIKSKIIIDPQHKISNKVVCSTSKASDQPAHTRSLIRAFASRLKKLLTEYHLEFLSLRGGCTGSLESTHIKIPHFWKSHVTAHIILTSCKIVDFLQTWKCIEFYEISGVVELEALLLFGS